VAGRMEDLWQKKKKKNAKKPETARFPALLIVLGKNKKFAYFFF
jgi:hypothetical protein